MALTEERRKELEALLGAPAQVRQQSQNTSVADQLESALGLKPTTKTSVFGTPFMTKSGIPTDPFGVKGEMPTIPDEETFGGKVIGGIKTGTEKVVGGVSSIAKKGAEQFMKGLQDIGKLVTGEPIDFISPTAAEDISKLGGDIGNILEGGLQATFAAPGAVAEMIPGVKQGMEFVGKKIELTADEFTKAIGQDPTSEEGKRTKQAVSNFLNLVTLYAGGKAGRAIAEGKTPLAKDIRAVSQKGVDFVKQGVEKIDTAITEATKPTPLIPEVPVKPTKMPKKGTEQAAKIVQSTQKIDPTKEIAFEKMSKKKVGDWLVERDIIAPREETVSILTDRWVKAKKALDEGVAKIPGQYSHLAVERVLNELIDFYKNTANREGLSLSRRRLKTLKDEGLTMPEVLNVKRDYERHAKVNYLKENNATAVERATNLDSDIREFFVETAEQKGFGNIRDLSKEIQQSRFLAEEIYRKLQKQRPNNLFGLTDNLLLVGGAINPKALVALGLKKAISSETFKSFFARKLGAPKVAKPIPEVPTRRIELKAKQEAFRNKPPSPKGKGVIPQTKGQQRITTKEGFKTEPKLSLADKIVESKAFEKILKQEDQILAEYKAENGKYINSDKFRRFFEDEGYIGSNSAAVQEPVSYLGKRAYTDALNNEGRLAIATGGGSGAGKSTALENIPQYTEALKDAAVVYDSNLSNFESLVKKVDEATASSKKFQEFYVYREPLDAFENGVVYRMKNKIEEKGRLVPTSVVAENHIGSWEVAKRFEDAGGKVYYVDNSLGKGKAKLVTRQQLEAKIKYPSVKELTAKFNEIVERLYKKGEISLEEYKGYIGK